MRTAYQFHGCFFHGCPKCYDQNETNSMNGKTMATLFEKTRCNAAYLRRHVEVVLKNRRSGGGFNRGFRVRDSSVMTYMQERAALTYFYGKRKVLADGLTTAPLEV